MVWRDRERRDLGCRSSAILRRTTLSSMTLVGDHIASASFLNRDWTLLVHLFVLHLGKGVLVLHLLKGVFVL